LHDHTYQLRAAQFDSIVCERPAACGQPTMAGTKRGS
jgi:hypothetical protein